MTPERPHNCWARPRRCTAWAAPSQCSSRRAGCTHVRGTSVDVSVRFLAVYVGGFAVWLLYGIGIGDVPVIVVHAVGLVCGTVTLAVELRLRGPAAEKATSRSAGEDRSRARPGRPSVREPEHEARPVGVRVGLVERMET